MNNWKNKFEPHILKRGIEYCEKGWVGQVEENGFGFSAPVYGSEEYDVCIYVEKDEIVAMTCICPYAEGGENCKHMAVVLTAISRAENDENRDRGKRNSRHFSGEGEGKATGGVLS